MTWPLATKLVFTEPLLQENPYHHATGGSVYCPSGVLMTSQLSPSVHRGLWAAVRDPGQTEPVEAREEAIGVEGDWRALRTGAPGPHSEPGSLLLAFPFSLSPLLSAECSRCLPLLLGPAQWKPKSSSHCFQPLDPRDTREPSLAAAGGKPREGARGWQGILPKWLQSQEALTSFLKKSTSGTGQVPRSSARVGTQQVDCSLKRRPLPIPHVPCGLFPKVPYPFLMPLLLPAASPGPMEVIHSL